jgi:hypothetical protein
VKTTIGRRMCLTFLGPMSASPPAPLTRGSSSLVALPRRCDTVFRTENPPSQQHMFDRIQVDGDREY